MISVCMIVKDEEENLKKSLPAVKKLGYEIVIVDTGSADKTKSVALQYTDKVFDYKWNNDFSDARNFAVKKTSNDVVLILDADEIITDIDKNQLEKMTEENSLSIGKIHIENEYMRNNEKYVFNEYVYRVFNKNYFEFSGKIHEQIVCKNKDNQSVSRYTVPVFVKHNGYSDSEILRKNKIDRNISMLKEAIEHKNEPYLYYQLGKSYYMNREYKKAAESFEDALDCNVDTKYEYVEDLVESYGYALINIKRYKDALVILNLYDEYKWSADYLFLCGLIDMNNGIFDEAIRMFMEASECNKSSMQGVNDYLAFYNIGVIYECLGNKYESLKYYNKCAGYEKAEDRIKKIKQSVVYK